LSKAATRNKAGSICAIAEGRRQCSAGNTRGAPASGAATHQAAAGRDDQSGTRAHRGAVLAKQTEVFDSARKSLFAPTGANPYEIPGEHRAKPQGQCSAGQVLLQAPASPRIRRRGELHVRNEHANVQYRINGIALPTASARSADRRQRHRRQPGADHGRDAGTVRPAHGRVVDIQTKQSAFDNTGTVSVYGGSRGTITRASNMAAPSARPVLCLGPLFRE